MPTEIFDKETFERSLPRLQIKSGDERLDAISGTGSILGPDDSRPMWIGLGLVAGEYCYVIPITEEVEIYIRSSVNSSGLCAGTGQDSIRCTLVDSINRKPLASKDAKPQRWIARTKNWRINLLDLLRQMWRTGRHLGTCPKCRVHKLRLNRVKKGGPNQGRLFIACESCQNGPFWWVQEDGSVIKSR